MNETSSENQVSHLPKGWVLTTLSEVINFTNGFAFKSSDYKTAGVKIVRIGDIQNNSLNTSEMNCVGENLFENLDKKFRVEPNDLVIAMSGATTGKLGFNKTTEKLLLNQRVGKFEFFLVSSKYAFYYLSTKIQENLSISLGSAIPNLSTEQINNISFPLPPLAEQERIVLKIEELFTKLDAGVSELKQAQAQLKRYRQSILKSAVTGELTRDWRKANQTEPAEILLKLILKERREKWEADQLKKFAEAGKTPKNADWKKKYKEPASPSTENLPELPKGWTWASIDELASFEPNSITDGPFGSNLKTSHYTDSGERVIRLKNIGDGYFIDAKAYISLEHSNFLRKHQIKANDLAIATLGERLPRACIIPEFVGQAIVKADCIKFSSNLNAVLPKYVNFALNAENTRNRVTESVHGVGRPRLNLGEVREIALPLPPLAEQEKIVEEVERLLSVADAVEKTLAESLKQAERLRQSILQKAFTGKLVPQDKRDEPASILLERIKKEREAKKDAESKRRGETAKKPKIKVQKPKTKKAAQGNLPF
ncbi:MAG: restriction endonuclease subunit S [Pyrinomonadaceae bacterium]